MNSKATLVKVSKSPTLAMPHCDDIKNTVSATCSLGTLRWMGTDFHSKCFIFLQKPFPSGIIFYNHKHVRHSGFKHERSFFRSFFKRRQLLKLKYFVICMQTVFSSMSGCSHAVFLGYLSTDVISLFAKHQLIPALHMFCQSFAFKAWISLQPNQMIAKS